MSDELRELYQELVFDHGMHPRHRETLPNPQYQNEQFNPMCGDRVCLAMHCSEHGSITEAKFQGEGCAISMASTSLMLSALQNQSVEQAEKLCQAFFDIIYERGCDEQVLGKIAVLKGVCQYPARVKCATLPWHALEAVIKEHKGAQKNV